MRTRGFGWLAPSQIFEKKSRSIKNFGVWIRYDSRSGTHNMYKEYRELTRSHAIAACYQDLAARHRARFSNIQIIKIAEVATKDVRRAYTKQFLVRGVNGDRTGEKEVTPTPSHLPSLARHLTPSF